MYPSIKQGQNILHQQTENQIYTSVLLVQQPSDNEFMHLMELISAVIFVFPTAH